ncbi:hypothetical protein [Sphingobium sp. CECT 9361]|uniref:hypothetical protein n=1 Tax=Sphingobium sp. CECT 9361 TaxID=2845384 RepID=UPI001E3863C7|nr:hypothetical protein [Sphingobium sp. CECT 9361]CAH0348258.1 hypothetical protein SPH9361_00009 [Sphingobium sp. CECT 9361]
MGLTTIVAVIAFLCGMLITGIIASWVISITHLEAVKMVDAHLALPGFGPVCSLTSYAAQGQAHG